MTKQVEKEIYLIRHGETDHNRNGIVQGRGVDTVLNKKGIEQAKAFHKHFKHIKFDTIFTSSLKRTRQTVEPFIKAGYKIKIHEDLDEINWGIHEGKQGNDILSQDYRLVVNKWRAGSLHEKIENGESALDLQGRQKRFVKILRNGSGKTILICSHGRAIRSFLCTLLEIDLCRMDDFPHQNLSLYKIIYDGERFEVEIFNSLEHLK